LEKVLEFFRSDVLSTGGLQEIFFPSRDPEEAVFVQGAQISRAEPAIDEGNPVFLRKMVITGCHVGATHQYLPAAAAFRSRKFLAQLSLDARNGAPHGTQPDRARVIHGDYR